MSPDASTSANDAVVLSSQRTATSAGGMPPSTASGSGARRVHSTTPVGSGSPEATPSVNGSPNSTGASVVVVAATVVEVEVVVVVDVVEVDVVVLVGAVVVVVAVVVVDVAGDDDGFDERDDEQAEARSARPAPRNRRRVSGRTAGVWRSRLDRAGRASSESDVFVRVAGARRRSVSDSRERLRLVRGTSLSDSSSERCGDSQERRATRTETSARACQAGRRSGRAKTAFR